MKTNNCFQGYLPDAHKSSPIGVYGLSQVDEEIPSECENNGCQDAPTKIITYISPGEVVYYCPTHARRHFRNNDNAINIDSL